MESEQSLLSSWDFIWCFFMYSPRVRSYLFQDFQPPVDQIVNSFLNDPIIFGYEYPITQQVLPSPPLHLPDIGDLKTVWKSVDGTLLGHAFGNKGLFPIIPQLYAYTKNVNYRNAKANIRRTALKYVSIENIECFLSIEFAWMMSGVLAVTTCYFGMRTLKGDRCPDKNGPVIESGEIRFFLPAEASALKNLSDCFDGYALCRSNQRKDPSLKISLPSRLLNPSYDFKYNVHEPEDFKTPELLGTCLLDKVKNSLIAQVSMASSTVERFDQCLGLELAHHFRNRDFSYSRFCGVHQHNRNLYEEQTRLWRKYLSMIQESRQTGLQCVVIQAKSTIDAPKANLGHDSVQYKCLCTRYGLSIKGRVQKLLNQLNLHYSRPDLDYILLSFGAAQFNPIFDFNLTQIMKCDVNIRDVEKDKTSSRSIEYNIAHTKDERKKTCTGQIDEIYDRSVEANVNEELVSQIETMNATCYEDYVVRGETRDNNLRDSRLIVRSENLYSDETALNNKADEETSSRHQNTENSVLAKRKRTFQINDDSNGNYSYSKDSAETKITGTKKAALSSSSTGCYLGKNEKQNGTLNCTVEGKKVSGDNSDIELWKCNQCGIVIRGKRGNLKRHILLKHYNLRQFQCQYAGCGRKFQNRVNLNRHEAAVHDGRPFQCSKCTRKFKQKDDVEIHLKNAHDKSGSAFKCDVCGSCFDLKGTLNRHKRTVHNFGSSSIANL